MQNFKNKLYDFEVTPPENIWSDISKDLAGNKIIKITDRKKSKSLYYLAIAAASLVIIFLGSLFFKHNSPSSENSTTTVSNKIMRDSMALNHRILESIIHSPKEKHEIVLNDLQSPDIPKKYITVAGPEGQPVKISPKAATLIIAANNDFPPKPTWSKKVDKWQKIMLSSTISPTFAGIADLVVDASNMEKLQ
ncbi:hypothetical protein EFY79_00360 [Hanamia caeni]|jgi:hypothetical protein|uniref:Uncharacterized protein n=1 Tax=Hanamia caeni TaxID=2294116 RepID=A0A3M9NRJ0_9BACT|nr:hypothetical protein [Hanamia caeni]RNI39793.1 hypothetical protein EFY79_00360 [Hanamia caeni]